MEHSDTHPADQGCAGALALHPLRARAAQRVHGGNAGERHRSSLTQHWCNLAQFALSCPERYARSEIDCHCFTAKLSLFTAKLSPNTTSFCKKTRFCRFLRQTFRILFSKIVATRYIYVFWRNFVFFDVIPGTQFKYPPSIFGGPLF